MCLQQKLYFVNLFCNYIAQNVKHFRPYLKTGFTPTQALILNNITSNNHF